MCFIFFNDAATTEIYTLSLHDALPISLDHRGLGYDLNEGDGAFYGPKIDLHMTDTIGRSWQLGTVQLDYSMPERFELSYTGADNAEHMPVMIHRRSEEHTSELQSRQYLVCRLLLEKKIKI